MSVNIRKVVADFNTSLSTKISAGDTTFTLSSATDDSSVVLADGQYCFTINNGSSNKEYLVGTLDGSTKIVTAVSTVTRQGVETSGAVNEHRVGSPVIISDFTAILDVVKTLRGEKDLDGDNPIEYDAEPTLASRTEVATVGYVLDNTNGGTVSVAGLIVAGNGGEVLAAGDVVFFDTADQEWKLADADTTYGDDVQFGIAQGAGTDGGAITGGVLVRGVDDNQTGLTAGATQYVSATAGDLTESAPTNDIFAGVALSTTDILVNFENRITDYIDTDDLTQSADLQTQTTSTNTIEAGEADATTKKNSLAQSFTASKTKMRGFKLHKKADTGTFTGNVVVTLQADSSGEPSGSALATATISNANWLLLTDDAEFEAIFASEYTSLTVGDTYWIDVQPSTSDNSNHPNLGGDTSGGDGTLYYNNTTDGWTQITSAYLYYKTMEGNTNQVVKTGSTGKIDPELILSQETFTASGTWTKPSSGTMVLVQAWGAGGSGGAGSEDDDGNAAGNGGGGGSGAYTERWINFAELGSTETVTVGAGGAAKVETDNSANGNPGGVSSFGSIVYAYGGGGGGSSTSPSAVSYGGGGGGLFGVGDNGDTTAIGEAGAPGTPLYGGNGLAVGIYSVVGGKGTGAGGGSGAGSDSIFSGAGGGGGHATGDDANSAAGGTSQIGGNGGAGAGTTHGDATATAGSVPGGGGGGAGCARFAEGQVTATSGAGGDGQIIVTVI